ncbi:MAG: hypothetical protein ACTII7_05360 [Galactobacter sp.]
MPVYSRPRVRPGWMIAQNRFEELSHTVHLLNTWSGVEVFLAASTDPSIPATTDDQFRDYGPGFAGFVATGAMVLVVIFLIWDMTRRIRRIRYQSEQQERQAELVAAGEEEAAQRRLAQSSGPQSSAQAAAQATVADDAAAGSAEAAGNAGAGVGDGSGEPGDTTSGTGSSDERA